VTDTTPATESQAWTALRVEDWTATRDTLHMCTQIVGKIRLSHAPLINHWWQVTLYVSPRGLTTSAIPYGIESFGVEFDFINHRLQIRSSDGGLQSAARVLSNHVRGRGRTGPLGPLQPGGRAQPLGPQTPESLKRWRCSRVRPPRSTSP
jgi:hypothetical protein